VVTEAPAPAPVVTQLAAPPPEPERQQPQAPAPAAPAPVAAPAGPEATCAGKRALAYFGCMERECVRGRFKDHPDCLKWHAQARRNSGE